MLLALLGHQQGSNCSEKIHSIYYYPYTRGKNPFVWIAKPMQNFLHLLSMWSNLWAEQIPSQNLSLQKNMQRTINKTFTFLPYPIPNLDYVSHTRFKCVVITKPFRYLNYEEDYVGTAYLTTYLDFVVATQSMSSQWGNKCGHYKI